ncbi:MAG: hypothetical protein KIT56_01490 [Gammaproteobacteria bacterium]|nr:hypothetical protein [Gammaproteobacteria bacterium]MCW5582557.1 hypothetical protein [Gammaproteobacteria bacterium]
MKSVVTIFIALILTGCATILSGTSQVINVKVVNSADQSLLSNVSCTVTDGNGSTYSIVSNPAVINVSKGNGAIIINCRKPGYRQLNMAVGDNFNALTVVNVLFWPGFIVDAVSGAYKKYPSHYMISMEKMK